MVRKREKERAEILEHKLLSLLTNVELLLVPLAGVVGVLLTDVWCPGDGPSGTIFQQVLENILTCEIKIGVYI